MNTEKTNTIEDIINSYNNSMKSGTIDSLKDITINLNDSELISRIDELIDIRDDTDINQLYDKLDSLLSEHGGIKTFVENNNTVNKEKKESNSEKIKSVTESVKNVVSSTSIQKIIETTVGEKTYDVVNNLNKPINEFTKAVLPIDHAINEGFFGGNRALIGTKDFLIDKAKERLEKRDTEDIKETNNDNNTEDIVRTIKETNNDNNTEDIIRTIKETNNDNNLDDSENDTESKIRRETIESEKLSLFRRIDKSLDKISSNSGNSKFSFKPNKRKTKKMDGIFGILTSMFGNNGAMSKLTGAILGLGFLKALSPSIGKLTGVTGKLVGSVGVIGAAMAGWEVGKLINKTVEEYAFDGKDTIGTKLYSLVNGDDDGTSSYIRDNLEKKGVYKHNYIGNSTVDMEKIKNESPENIEAILKGDDLDENTKKELNKLRIKKISERRAKYKIAKSVNLVKSLPKNKAIELVGKNTYEALMQKEKGKQAQDYVNQNPQVKKKLIENVFENKEVNKQYDKGGASSLAVKHMLDTISKGEGNTDYDTTFAFGKYDVKGRKKLTDMTISEVYEHQKKMIAIQKKQGISKSKRSSASGKYQFIQNSLLNTAKELGLDINTTKFTADIQDKMGEQILRNQGGLNQFEKDGDRKKFRHHLATTWASSPDLNGKSYYGQHIPKNQESKIDSAIDEVASSRLDVVNIKEKGNIVDVTETQKTNTINKLESINQETKSIISSVNSSKDGNQTVVAVNQPSNATSREATPDTPLQGNPRNMDSSIARVTDKQLSHGMV